MTESKKPDKQRKAQANRAVHQKSKDLRAHLAEDLLIRYDTRSIRVRVDDTVEIMRGDYKGEEGTVLDVDTDRGLLTVEGAMIEKADGTQAPKWLEPSNVRVVDLDLSDPRRRAELGRQAEQEWEQRREEEE